MGKPVPARRSATIGRLSTARPLSPARDRAITVEEIFFLTNPGGKLNVVYGVGRPSSYCFALRSIRTMSL